MSTGGCGCRGPLFYPSTHSFVPLSLTSPCPQSKSRPEPPFPSLPPISHRDRRKKNVHVAAMAGSSPVAPAGRQNENAF